jgi:peptidoglycan-associated lipoprotein
MNTSPGIAVRLALAGLILSLSACASYVKRDEFDSAIAELRQTDAELQRQIDALAQDLRATLASHQVEIERLRGRLSVNMAVHFEFDRAELRDRDRPVLDDFGRVMREHHRSALVTVEGFADPAGPAAYNERLGMRRAGAVRDYLVSTGGLDPNRVRAVSYGEAADRHVHPGAWGPDGERNRRVVLVIDDIGPG